MTPRKSSLLSGLCGLPLILICTGILICTTFLYTLDQRRQARNEVTFMRNRMMQQVRQYELLDKRLSRYTKLVKTASRETEACREELSNLKDPDKNRQVNEYREKLKKLEEVNTNIKLQLKEAEDRLSEVNKKSEIHAASEKEDQTCSQQKAVMLAEVYEFIKNNVDLRTLTQFEEKFSKDKKFLDIAKSGSLLQNILNNKNRQGLDKEGDNTKVKVEETNPAAEGKEATSSAKTEDAEKKDGKKTAQPTVLSNSEKETATTTKEALVEAKTSTTTQSAKMLKSNEKESVNIQVTTAESKKSKQETEEQKLTTPAIEKSLATKKSQLEVHDDNKPKKVEKDEPKKSQLEVHDDNKPKNVEKDEPKKSQLEVHDDNKPKKVEKDEAKKSQLEVHDDNKPKKVETMKMTGPHKDVVQSSESRKKETDDGKETVKTSAKKDNADKEASDAEKKVLKDTEETDRKAAAEKNRPKEEDAPKGIIPDKSHDDKDSKNFQSSKQQTDRLGKTDGKGINRNEESVVDGERRHQGRRKSEDEEDEKKAKDLLDSLNRRRRRR